MTMGLFGKAKRRLGYQDASLRETGLQGTATVTDAKEMFLRGGSGDDSDTPMYKLTLRVALPDGDPYEVVYRIENGLEVGREYPVFVDPKDPEHVYVDAGGDLRERLAADRAQMQQALSELKGMTGSSATAMPAPGAAGLTPEWQEMMATNAASALKLVKDPVQRKMLIEQYRAAGIPIEDDAGA
jgi:uncharacterized protein DUF3592